MVDFFPKPNKKLITAGQALKDIKPDIYKKTPKCLVKKKEGYGFNWRYINLKKPSPAIIKNSGLISHERHRTIALNECKTLCSFPKEWKLIGSYSEQWNRLGNAVMPKFMQAIAQHIKTEILKKENPTVISTFAGTGGSSLGYKWAGYKELLAIDFEPHATECFKLNFPELPVWTRDIKTVTSEEILTACKIKKGELDVLDGSPPCQGFSTAGKRQVTDPRNDLFLHYWRLVKELQPRVFIMENVTGMVKGKMKGRFIEIMKLLKSDNYTVKCKQMNSKYYGVPQSRERLIFIGVRKDIIDKL